MRIFVDSYTIDNGPSLACITQRSQSFLQVDVRRGYGTQHRSSRVSTQTFLENSKKNFWSIFDKRAITLIYHPKGYTRYIKRLHAYNLKRSIR